ncbi:MAG: hypothetical protein ACU0BF_09205 [Paracoccaceae bacterium]
MGRFADTARAAWGLDVPDWVIRLAQEADAGSQTAAARTIGVSGSLVSQVLRNRYPGNLARIEELVTGKLMGAVIACPALGEIATSDCQAWRRKADAFVASNSLRVAMFRACNRCPVKLAEREAARSAQKAGTTTPIEETET